jgi:1,4-alpha-glucan branching enzyme
MPVQVVDFQFITGLKRAIFRNARLRGSWDSRGRYSDQWTESSMQEVRGEDGCPTFTASVQLDLADSGKTFAWGVVLDGPQGPNGWGIPTEVQDLRSTDRYRQFRLSTQPGARNQVERYYFSYARHLGANKHLGSNASSADLRFAVWAPNAKKVEVVFGLPDRGYIADDGTGIDTSRPPLSMQREPSGIWESEPLADFSAQVGLPYMYRVTNAQDSVVYRTDIFSRQQIGCGAVDPATHLWPGTIDTLDGTVSCSVVVDPDTIAAHFAPPTSRGTERISDEDFWAHEFTPALPVPKSRSRHPGKCAGLSGPPGRTRSERRRVVAAGAVRWRSLLGLW